MDNTISIAVTSPSFSRNDTLCAELRDAFPNVRLRTDDSRFTRTQLRDYLYGAQGAIIGLETIDDALLSELPSLKIVAKYGVGLDTIDQQACRTHKVAIGWTGGVNALSVAEMTLCFMLGSCRNIFKTSTQLRQGTWDKRGGRQLSGKIVGIVGVGHIGKELIRLLQPFGCRILANDIADVGQFCRTHDVELADKDTLFRCADIVSLHVPLTSETKHLVNMSVLSTMKKSAFLINTSRGEVVDQEALKAALLGGKIGGAALDVFETEPPDDLDFLGLPQLIATPHIGGNAEEAVLSMGRSAIQHLKAYFKEHLR